MPQPCIPLEVLTCHTSQRRVSTETPHARLGVSLAEGEQTAPSEMTSMKALLEHLFEDFFKARQPDNAAYNYKLAQLRSLDPASQATQLVALNVIATALSDPTLFDFYALVALLQTFLSRRPSDLHNARRHYLGIRYATVTKVEC
ncbi:hypothetical protein EDB83DRAFT_2523432 [Lactarius deliciosus]|nr:hypothetical protein EDB83DRAFT_2523432 [Lactarius deliciosus]